MIMDLIKNIPFISIMLCMFSAIISSVLSAKAATILNRIVMPFISLLSLLLLISLHASQASFVFFMGHFPAPWGNEIRAGELEALMAIFVTVVAFLSVSAGFNAISFDIEDSKINLYFVLTNLMVSSLLAMIYTNDLFTAYVFIEINTIAGCGLIMVRQNGKSIVTAVRYMVISLLGSGLFLIGVSLLYTITGHLLMSNIQESVNGLIQSGDYMEVLTVIIALMTVGICIKAGLFPFHLWIPDAYGYSNVSSSALLSGIVSKGYIFLLIKIYFRVLGLNNVISSSVLNILFVLGVVAIIMGSVFAIFEKNFRKVVAYSSVAQIGYIFMGIGLGTIAGMSAAIFHILAHGFTKSLLFVSSSQITEGSHSKSIDDIYGLGHKFKFSSFCFSLGAFSMVGFPFLAGFASKLLFGQAGIYESPVKMLVIIFALAISTILNSIYFFRIVIRLYAIPGVGKIVASETDLIKSTPAKLKYFLYIGLLAAFNILLGCFSSQIINIISNGLSVFD